MSQPKVSVIVPIYNVEAYLRPCIESILAQTLPDLEIILMDDGSTDSCAGIIDYYAKNDERIVVVHKENEGYGRSCNRAIDMATGEFVGIVESDDFIDPKMYERLYDYAVKLGADVVKGPFRDCFSTGGPTGPEESFLARNTLQIMTMLAGQDGQAFEGPSATMIDDRHRPYPFNDFLSDNMPKGRLYSLQECPCQLATHQSIWAGIYRRSYLNEHNIRFEELPGAGHVDIRFCVESLMHTDKLAWLDTMFYNYRVEREGSSTQTYSVTENASGYRKMQDILLEHPDLFHAAAPFLVSREAIGLYHYYRNADYTEEDLEVLHSLFSDFTEDEIARAPLIDEVRRGEILACREGTEQARATIDSHVGLGTVASLIIREVGDFGWFQIGVLALLAMATVALAAGAWPLPPALFALFVVFALAAFVSCILVVAFPVRRVIAALRYRL